MTQFGGLDPISFLNDFNAYVAKMEDQARDLAAAQASAAHEASHQYVTMKVLGGRIQSLEFTDAAASASPVHLRSAIMDTYTDATAHANSNLAASLSNLGLGDIAQGVRDSASPQVQEAAAGIPDEDIAGTHAGPRTEPEKVPWTSVEDMWADASVDDEDLTDIEADFRDLGLTLDGSTRTGQDWQQEFDRDIARIIEETKGMRGRLEQISATAECKTMSVTVNGFGLLQDVLIRPGAKGRSAEELTGDFREVYDSACAEASQHVTEVTGETDLPDFP